MDGVNTLSSEFLSLYREEAKSSTQPLTDAELKLCQSLISECSHIRIVVVEEGLKC